ncbi:MAG: Ig-like domain-containing protein [Bryobacteraceae bacterium]
MLTRNRFLKVGQAVSPAFVLALVLLPSAFAQSQPILTFADVSQTARFYGTTDLMRERGLTVGCAGYPVALYCPDLTVTRGQMAVFLARAIYSSISGDANAFPYVPSTPYFTDVPSGHGYFNYIQVLRYLNVIEGCSDTMFCPDDGVTNFLAAKWTARARQSRNSNGAILDPGYVPTGYSEYGYFVDVGYYDTRFPWVQKARQLSGSELPGRNCPSSGWFCPDALLSRGDASFYIIYGVMGQPGLLPAQPYEGGSDVSLPYVLNGPDCGLTGTYQMWVANDVYAVTSSDFYTFSFSEFHANDGTLWSTYLQTTLLRNSGAINDSGLRSSGVRVEYRYPGSGTASLTPGTYEQRTYHFGGSGACNTYSGPLNRTWGPQSLGSSGSVTSVSVSPSTAVALTAGQTQQFTATVTVTGGASTAVNWTISPSVGSVSASGLYTAPSPIASNQTITVTATSVFDTSKFGSGTVNLPDGSVLDATQLHLRIHESDPGRAQRGLSGFVQLRLGQLTNHGQQLPDLCGLAGNHGPVQLYGALDAGKLCPELQHSGQRAAAGEFLRPQRRPRGHADGPNDDTASVRACVDSVAEHVFCKSRRSGRREPCCRRISGPGLASDIRRAGRLEWGQLAQCLQHWIRRLSILDRRLANCTRWVMGHDDAGFD